LAGLKVKSKWQPTQMVMMTGTHLFSIQRLNWGIFPKTHTCERGNPIPVVVIKKVL
jgi:hypothetical protein